MTDLLRSDNHRPTRHRRLTIPLLIAVAALGLVSTLLVDRADASPPRYLSEHGSTALIPTPTVAGTASRSVDDDGADDRTADVHPSGVARRACNPRPPEYPGCTITQINSWEDGDLAAAKAHYPQNRWGQAGFNWSNLGDAHNDKLRRLYNAAVDAYVAKQKAKGVSGKAAQPRFATWGDFKAGTDCAGGFWGALWSTMCRFTDTVDDAVPDVAKMTIVCGGWAVVAGSVARGTAIVMSTVAPEAAIAAAVGSTALCTLMKIAGALGIPTPKMAPHTAMPRLAAGDVVDSVRLDWRAVSTR